MLPGYGLGVALVASDLQGSSFLDVRGDEMTGSGGDFGAAGTKQDTWPHVWHTCVAHVCHMCAILVALVITCARVNMLAFEAYLGSPQGRAENRGAIPNPLAGRSI